ncbi:MAG: DUF4105 domain-containing protein [Sphingobacteriales bacterium]|nr:MAG: DUF4105 domain-containing protein [Sphingobacteriales bacterium]
MLFFLQYWQTRINRLIQPFLLGLRCQSHYIYMKRICILLLLLLSTFDLFSQNDSTDQTRMSLLTCGVGDELYASFGHTAIRYTDPAKGIDEIYNYGMFDFADPDFLMKFTRGKLLYYVGIGSYNNFVEDYSYEQRSVIEQELDLSPAQKSKILAFLKDNLKPENKYYKYDFLYDNCATRIRDIFPGILGPGFRFGASLPEGRKISFRKIIDEYQRNNHWARLGINIVLGSRIDKVMTNEEAMFLPDMLMQGMATAKLDGKAIVAGAPKQVVKGTDRTALSPNGPMWAMIALLLFTLIVFFVRPLQVLKPFIAFLHLLLSGLLGAVLLFMWLGTDHQSCANNYNLLWALPFNLPFALTVFKPRSWHKQYSLIAIVLLILALMVHVIGIQAMPLTELLPFFLCLLYVYLFVYKRAIGAFGGGAGSSVAQ